MNFQAASILVLFGFLTACGGSYESTNQDATNSSQNEVRDNCPGPDCVADVPPPLDTPVPVDAILVSNASELMSALQNAAGGDTIALASGNYGKVTINGRNFPSKVFIRPQNGATPVFKSIVVQNSSQLQISGVSVLPRLASGDAVGTAVTLQGSDIVFEKSLVNFAEDSSTWTASQWINLTGNGIEAGGARVIVRENVVKNVAFGISTGATYGVVSRNKVNGFRGDGLRGLGDHSLIEYNDVRNCKQVDGNHMDGFQSWTLGTGGPGSGVQTGVVIRGNYFLERDTANPIVTCNLQAISMFDGMFKDWVVENNVVIVNHYHAISFYGAINLKIVNNTVIDLEPTDNIRPWIMVTTHKNGTPSQNCIIRNNIAPTISPDSGTVADHNLIVNSGNINQIFMNPGAFDLRLKAGSAAIDAGSSLSAPVLDFLELDRVVGAGVDIGAYEYQ